MPHVTPARDVCTRRNLIRDGRESANARARESGYGEGHGGACKVGLERINPEKSRIMYYLGNKYSNKI